MIQVLHNKMFQYQLGETKIVIICILIHVNILELTPLPYISGVEVKSAGDILPIISRHDEL